MKTSPKPRIRLVLVDDSQVVRMGLRALLSTEPRVEILGEAGSVSTAVETCLRLKPEVVLLDIRLPDGTGFDACRQILAKLPDTRVLVLTSVADETLVDEALRAGAHGYLLKEIDSRGLLQAVFDVAEGKSTLDPAVTALDNAYLYNLDDLAKIAEENRRAREAEVVQARAILAEKSATLWRAVADRLGRAAGEGA